MAIKAGRVGVAPSQVDMAGNIVGGASESYTKAESDAKYATKTETAAFATKASLTANEKEFTFAYDATTQKYGYKLDGAGDFYPFESARVGFNITDPSVEGLTYDPTVTIDSGGYQLVDNICYVDIIFTTTHTSGTHYIAGFPAYQDGATFSLLVSMTSYAGYSATSLSRASSSAPARVQAPNAGTYRIYGQYPIKTT